MKKNDVQYLITWDLEWYLQLQEDVDKTMAAIKSAGDKPYVVGKIENGEKGVTLC